MPCSPSLYPLAWHCQKKKKKRSREGMPALATHPVKCHTQSPCSAWPGRLFPVSLFSHLPRGRGECLWESSPSRLAPTLQCHCSTRNQSTFLNVGQPTRRPQSPKAKAVSRNKQTQGYVIFPSPSLAGTSWSGTDQSSEAALQILKTCYHTGLGWEGQIWWL